MRFLLVYSIHRSWDPCAAVLVPCVQSAVSVKTRDRSLASADSLARSPKGLNHLFFEGVFFGAEDSFASAICVLNLPLLASSAELMRQLAIRFPDLKIMK